jgi:hypothetical protein
MVFMDVEFDAGDLGFLSARSVEVVALEVHLGEFGLEVFEGYAEIEHGADEHIAANAAEAVEEESFHWVAGGWARALIWLAA